MAKAGRAVGLRQPARADGPTASSPRGFGRVLRWCVAAVALAMAALLLDGGGPSSAMPGALDRTFAGDGTITTRVSRFASATDVAVARDGTITAAGAMAAAPGGADVGLLRFRFRGSLDASFATGGIVRTDIGADASTPRMAVMDDGRIVLASSVRGTPDGAEAPPRVAAVARYLPDGSLDPSFGGGDGIERVDLPSVPCGIDATDVALDAQDRAVVVGNGGCGGESGIAPRVAVLRLSAEGPLDATFGDRGASVTFAACSAGAVAIQDDGRIVVAGQHGGAYCAGPMTLLRLDPDGSADESFGDRGRTYVRFPGFDGALANAMALDARGRIVAAGFADRRRVESGDPERAVLALARLRPDGKLDPSFGTRGRRTASPPGGRLGWIDAIALAPDGRIVVAGNSLSRNGRRSRFVVGRFRAGGARDREFGAAGFREVPFGGQVAYATDVAVLRDRITAVGGIERRGTGPAVAIARLRAR